MSCGVSCGERWSGAEAAALSKFQKSSIECAFLWLVQVHDVATGVELQLRYKSEAANVRYVQMLGDSIQLPPVGRALSRRWHGWVEERWLLTTCVLSVDSRRQLGEGAAGLSMVVHLQLHGL